MNDQLLDDLLISNSDYSSKKWAGFWIRAGATMIDLLILIPILGIYFYNLLSLKILFVQLLIILLMMVYKPWMEFKYGATLGKMALNLKVVSTDFKALTLSQAIIRYIPWMAGSLISIYSSVLLFSNPDFMASDSWMYAASLQQSVLPDSVTYLNSFASLFLLASIIVVAFTHEKQGIHDIIAKTFCIYK
jgi:uncharacterized RDD family membrane protein YckC